MIKHYMSLVKFSHTIFAMPFAFIGFFLACEVKGLEVWSASGGRLLMLVVADMVFARNAAMAFNRWLDRNIDAKNIRTQKRELPSGIIQEKHALIFVIINSLLFLVTTFFINRLVFFLAPVALLVILGYSYTKRFTRLCHFILGIGLALAPLGAYLSVTAAFALLPVLFSFIVLFWTAGFDIIYSLQDQEFDTQNKLKSLPEMWGKKRALHFSELLHLLTMGFIVITGLIGADYLGIWYQIGALFFGALLLYQHTIVSPENLTRVNLAFFTTNGIASLVFAIFTITDLLMK